MPKTRLAGNSATWWLGEGVTVDHLLWVNALADMQALDAELAAKQARLKAGGS